MSNPSAETVALLAGVQQSLENRDRFSDEQRTFLERQPLQSFADALDHAVRLVNVSDPAARTTGAP